MFTKLLEALKATRRTIVFTEGPDARILEATDRLLKEDLMDVILIGNEAEVKAAAEKGNFCICKATIIDPATYEGMDEMVAKMVELRKGKMSEEDCRKALAKGNYFGTMLVKMGKADALLGGATYSTADTVRPALQLVKTKKGAHLVSSSFILFRKDKDGNDEKYCMGDCAINIDYQDTVDKATGEVTFTAAQKLAEVAVESARTAEFFGIDPKVALLSFSTKGSGKGGTVQLSHDATIEAQKLAPELAIDGEMQFDAAVSPVVGQLKFPGSKVAGYANTFIFPCIEAGNIGYKIAQRLGGFDAVLHTPEIKQRHGSRSAVAPRLERIAHQGMQFGADHAEEAGQRNGREPFGLGDADVGVGALDGHLGLLDIRAAFQQIGRHARRDDRRRWDGFQRHAALHGAIHDVLGRASEQGFQSAFRRIAGNARLVKGRLGGFHFRLGAAQVR